MKIPSKISSEFHSIDPFSNLSSFTPKLLSFEDNFKVPVDQLMYVVKTVDYN